MDITTNPISSYIGSFFQKNYVYAAGMNLVWQELKENIFHDDVRISIHDQEILSLVQSLNDFSLKDEDLYSQNYYVKAGFGQETIEIIKHDLRHKFPQKNFQDFQFKLSPQDLVAYAFLFQNVEYLVPFTIGKIFFEDINTPPGQLPPEVRGFRAETLEQKSNIFILSYTNPQRFIVRLKLRQEEEEIFLVKGFSEMNADQLVKMLQPFFQVPGETLQEQDYFHMPMLHLDHTYRYDALIGQKLANKGFENYRIAEMRERILFAMDEKGARVENEAFMAAPSAAEESGPLPKYFYLDKPFWVLMKRKGSLRPYFILGVNTTDLMERV